MKRSKGFTLIELIVVVAILAVFAGLFGAAFTGCTDQSGQAQQAARQYGQSMYGLSDPRAQCMRNDTDNNGYVSCTIVGTNATGKFSTIPVECAVDRVFSVLENTGCRAVIMQPYGVQ